MTWELSAEHEMLRQTIREFAEAEIAPHAERWDRDHHFPVDVVRAMGDLGLFGIAFPEEYGGGGGDLTTLCIAIEELARVDHSMAITLEAGVGLGANPIHRFGTEEQSDVAPRPVRRSGARRVRAHRAGRRAAMPAAPARAAVLDDADEWVINGEKAFITNSGTDDHRVRHGRRRAPGRRDHGDHRAGRHAGLRRAAAVPARWAGTPPTRTGSRSTTAGCPGRTCSASRGRGFAQLPARSSTRDASRSRRWPLGSIAGVPRARRSTTPSERHAFGRPIGANQGVAFQLRRPGRAGRDRPHPHLQGRVAAATRLARSRRRPPWPSSTPPKRRCTATRIATQIFGGYGFMDETPVARFYRDAKILEIGEGTSEVQRLVIARQLGLPVQ